MSHVSSLSSMTASSPWGCAHRIKTRLCLFKPSATQHKVCGWQMGFKLEDIQACTGSTMDWSCISCICEQRWICDSIPTPFKRQRVNSLSPWPKCITIVSFQIYVIFLHETYCKRCWAEYLFPYSKWFILQSPNQYNCFVWGRDPNVNNDQWSCQSTCFGSIGHVMVDLVSMTQSSTESPDWGEYYCEYNLFLISLFFTKSFPADF